MNEVELLPVKMVGEVEAERGVPWLIEGLWTEQGVGFLGGSPKSCKTWLALDLALSVATGTAALGHYGVAAAGPVLLFAAEDAPPMVRVRLSGMAQQRGLSLDDVPIHLVLASSLRLENATDQARLQATIACYRPKLVVLDPFVRLSRADENSALEVSAVLGFLRELQRSHHVAILVVHHARKSVSGNGAAAGMALRGSGDFWAWGDSNLYLGRKQEKLHLAIEHRSAAQPEPVMLELCSDRPDGPYLRLCDQMECQASEGLPLSDRILDVLRAGEAPQRLEDLRARLRVRMQTLVDTLRDLESEKMASRVAGGWQATTADDPTMTASGETAAGSAEEQPAKG